MTNVRFTANDTYLISCGGNDRFIFQWKCVPASDVDAHTPAKALPQEQPSKIPGGATKQVTGNKQPTTPQKSGQQSSNNVSKTPSKIPAPPSKSTNTTPSKTPSHPNPPRSNSALKATHTPSTPVKVTPSSSDKLVTTTPQKNSSSNPPPSSSPSQFIHLNLDGRIFHTTLETLTKDKNSKLAELFSKPQTLDRDAQGHYLLDLDPSHFAPILNYLRYGCLIIDPNASREGVLACAQYLKIAGVIQALSD